MIWAQNELPEVGGWPGTVIAVLLALMIGPWIPAAVRLLFGNSDRGLLASWDEWRDRKAKQEAARAQDERDVTVEALQKTVAALERQLNRVRDHLDEFEREVDADRDEWKRKNAELQKSLQEALEYIVFVTNWARRQLLWAAEQGVTLPPPDWLPYYEWLEKNGGTRIDPEFGD